MVELGLFWWEVISLTKLYWLTPKQLLLSSNNDPFRLVIYNKKKKIFYNHIFFYCRLQILLNIDTVICWQLNTSYLNDYTYFLQNKRLSIYYQKQMAASAYERCFNIFLLIPPVMIHHLSFFHFQSLIIAKKNIKYLHFSLIMKFQNSYSFRIFYIWKNIHNTHKKKMWSTSLLHINFYIKC